MYTGDPPNWAQGMWFHKGYYSGFSADGVSSGDYNCSPASSPLGIGTVAHENGHMIGKWPDTYKYDSDHGYDGIGAFDLMCWYGSQSNPVPPNPLFRSNVGWGRVVDVTGYNGLNLDTANSGTCYKYVNLNDTTEFFLIESRIQTGRSNEIDDEGLTIWHIDRKGNNQTWHHEVALVPANNIFSSQWNACFRAGFKDEYSATTLPASHFYNGDASGLRVWDIGPVNSIMQYKLGLGAAGPSLKSIYNSIGNDDNGNGSYEAGESAEIAVTGKNIGETASGMATMTCTAVGPNAAHVTVNTAPVLLGVLNVGSSVPAVFNFTIHPTAPLGDYVQLRFEISDGVSSDYFTRDVLVGYLLPMDDNLDETTCGALFYDMGVENNYADNKDYTKTIYPATPGEKISVNFMEFEVESHSSCNYDYLEIYDGPSTASTLLGRFCGEDLPGIFTSTDATGALTFKFHSDSDLHLKGWKAKIICGDFTGLQDDKVAQDLKVYPNPTAGILRIELQEESSAQILVRDITGRVVAETKPQVQKTFGIDLSGKNDGVYLVEVHLNNRIYTQRVVVQK